MTPRRERHQAASGSMLRVRAARPPQSPPLGRLDGRGAGGSCHRAGLEPLSDVPHRDRIRSAIWVMVESWLVRGSLVAFLVLAGLLTPADFGVMALAGIYLTFCTFIIDQGFGTAPVGAAHGSGARTLRRRLLGAACDRSGDRRDHGWCRRLGRRSSPNLA